MEHWKPWQHDLFDQYARLLEAHGPESAIAEEFSRWHAGNPEAKEVLAGARLIYAVFGTCHPQNWKNAPLGHP